MNENIKSFLEKVEANPELQKKIHKPIEEQFITELLLFESGKTTGVGKQVIVSAIA